MQPVFVLCAGRSGSTLLRFLLDAHPEFGCPPENSLPALLAELAKVWSGITGVPNAETRVPKEGNAAIAGVRRCADLMIETYLARAGKARYCDKNLGTAKYAELLLRVYPEAKFLCLYRHPMDVIASGIEACPWGLHSHGFESYVAASPGNSVHALARYWADHTAAIMAVEERFPERCHRVRYEDLVADPEPVAAGVFDFLGAARVPGISTRCFSTERERGGASDYKIWSTSRITADSVGRGWLVPANLIQAPARETLNRLAARLGYVQVGDDWGVGARPEDPRADAKRQAGQAAEQPVPIPPGVEAVNQRLQVGLSRTDEEFARRWKPYSQESFLVEATVPSGTSAWWRVDPIAPATGDEDHDQADWTITAPAEAWEQVIRGGVNLGVAFRRCGMRYIDKGDAGAGSVTADTRVAMLAELLELAHWSQA
jgi:hypothetical protein